ncbi:uncharacterized protein LOC130636551 isoform X2 [Hydractinia symbiolongicarpus]|nr:uncharacterized protein LOC130635375 isoform X2 [Hydractinia symbiolongicarpus]XP_057302298.1 uncharacterized protein LOC130636551 isoform X2 [Hydractinia symbiolongicarpus]
MTHNIRFRWLKASFGRKKVGFFIISIQVVLLLYYGQYLSKWKQHINSMKTPVLLFLMGDEIVKEISFIQNNYYLASLNIKPKGKKKDVTLLLIVSTGPRRYDRRATIRKTWWQQCKPTGKVVPECIFITDERSKGQEFYDIMKNESDTYHDMHFQNLSGGVEFGKRFLYHMVYAVTNYNFDYFLRMDDDYFFCMEKFLHEIPVPMEKYFHWGWIHDNPGITRPEESMILLSRDVIELFLSQDPNKMLCHPFADQMIAAWSNHINMTYLFRHDSRLHHHPPVRDLPNIKYSRNICARFIGVHGAYPQEMEILWNNSGSQKTQNNLKINTQSIIITNPFNWQMFNLIWRFEPKMCRSNPTWDTSKHFVVRNGTYSGRQDEHKQSYTQSASNVSHLEIHHKDKQPSTQGPFSASYSNRQYKHKQRRTGEPLGGSYSGRQDEYKQPSTQGSFGASYSNRQYKHKQLRTGEPLGGSYSGRQDEYKQPSTQGPFSASYSNRQYKYKQLRTGEPLGGSYSGRQDEYKQPSTQGPFSASYSNRQYKHKKTRTVEPLGGSYSRRKHNQKEPSTQGPFGASYSKRQHKHKQHRTGEPSSGSYSGRLDEHRQPSTQGPFGASYSNRQDAHKELRTEGPWGGSNSGETDEHRQPSTQGPLGASYYNRKHKHKQPRTEGLSRVSYSGRKDEYKMNIRLYDPYPERYDKYKEPRTQGTLEVVRILERHDDYK